MGRQQFFTITLSMLLYFLLWQNLYPIYQHYLDADATGYLAIAQRVAAGDWFKSINGLWSPLNCWILVPFIQKGHTAFTVAQHLNVFFGATAMMLTFLFVFKFTLHKWYSFALSICLPIAFVYYQFLQIFGDVLQLNFVLLYLLICSRKNYLHSLPLHLLAGVIMSIAFYAKAYALPLFILHTIVLHGWHFWQTKKGYLLNTVAGIAICLLCILPWSLQLSKKYNHFTIMGTSGSMNMSWYLNSHKSFSKDITYLIPPTYNNSISFWEDPYFSQSALSGPFDSSSLFVKWIARIIYTCFQCLQCITELHFMGLAFLLIGIYFLAKKKCTTEQIPLLLAGILLPLGYINMHVETRFLLLQIPAIACIAGISLGYFTVKWQKIIAIIFAIGFMAMPILQLKAIAFKGKDNFEIAQQLKALGISKNKISSNHSKPGELWSTCYQSNNYFYTIENFSYTNQQLLQELKRYKIEYFINVSSPKKLDYLGTGFTEVFDNGTYQIIKCNYF